MKNRKPILLFGMSIVLIVIVLWRWQKKTAFEYETEHESVSNIEVVNECQPEFRIEDSREDINELENSMEAESTQGDMSDRRFRDLIGEHNETGYEDLITVKYSAEEIEILKDTFESYIGTRCTMNWAYNDLKETYAFECVREADRNGYAMFQEEDGRLLCIYFDKRSLNINHVGIYRKFLSVRDYEEILPGVTRVKELYELSGELYSDFFLSSVDIKYCMAEEGTLLFYFRYGGYGWTEEDEKNPPLVKKVFIPDGEEPPKSCESVPEMLPIDKHIVENED